MRSAAENPSPSSSNLMGNSAENPDKNSPDLAMSEVTPGTSMLPSTTEAVVTSTDFTHSVIPAASTSHDTHVMATPFSPETLRPLPEAPLRKGNQTNRRKVKSAVLTDSPVKDELAAIEAARMAKEKVKTLNLEDRKTRKKSRPKTKKIKIVKKKQEKRTVKKKNVFVFVVLNPIQIAKPKKNGSNV